jgi:hypothetical protein
LNRDYFLNSERGILDLLGHAIIHEKMTPELAKRNYD